MRHFSIARFLPLNLLFFAACADSTVERNTRATQSDTVVLFADETIRPIFDSVLTIYLPPTATMDTEFNLDFFDQHDGNYTLYAFLTSSFLETGSFSAEFTQPLLWSKAGVQKRLSTGETQDILSGRVELRLQKGQTFEDLRVVGHVSGDIEFEFVGPVHVQCWIPMSHIVDPVHPIPSNVNKDDLRDTDVNFSSPECQHVKESLILR